MSNLRTRGTQRRARFLASALALLVTAIVGTAPAAAAEPPLPAQAPTDAAVAPAPLSPTPAEQSLLAILDAGRVQVDALLAQAVADPARAEALQREICRIKAETNVRFLEKQVEFARASGDATRLDEAQRALANAVNPPAPAAVNAGQGVAK